MNALIVEDEPAARRRLRRLLGEEGVQVVGEAHDGDEAVAMIKTLHPDVVFLDIETPGQNGFEVIRSVGQSEMPPVVFVTAYGHYAVDAFEVRAVDYLVKPFDRARLGAALERVRVAAEDPIRLSARIESLLQRFSGRLERDPAPSPPRGENAPEWLLIKEDGQVSFLEVDLVEWIEADGNYVRLHSGKEAHLVRRKIGDLEKQLDPKRFLRIHRSAIVNLAAVDRLVPWFSGGYLVRLKSGEELKLSRSYAAVLFDAVGDRF